MEEKAVLKKSLTDKYIVKKVGFNPKYIEAFLNLPKQLYSSKNSPQNPSEEKQLLEAKHVLSHYFEFVAFLLFFALVCYLF